MNTLSVSQIKMLAKSDDAFLDSIIDAAVSNGFNVSLCFSVNPVISEARRCAAIGKASSNNTLIAIRALRAWSKGRGEEIRSFGYDFCQEQDIMSLPLAKRLISEVWAEI